ncbi:MAG: hypothetical protein H6738_04380 [Alphaproteobacteria bacterium]|nr:hypothetical protein [Alphaproteobacteria bacterium]MCB9696009.1 hypothetical protein [Alphaproteobacteria bacterium]
MTEPASYVVLHHPGVGEALLTPGDLVGRLSSATLRIEHPHISEVHAYVSLRDGVLKLLALRGGLGLDGKMVREVTLASDQRIQLAVGQTIEVVEVCNPTLQLALLTEDGSLEPLSGGMVSLVPGRGRSPRLEEDAAVVLWPDGDHWMVQLAGQPRPRHLEVGTELEVGRQRYRVVEVPIGDTQTPSTLSGARLDAPLRLEGFYDTIHVHREGTASLVLSGAAGRLLCELGAIGQPVHWADVARAVWDDESDIDRLRKRWDVLLIRLRRRLAAASVRTDLVHPDGTGNIRLLLNAADRFVDKS